MAIEVSMEINGKPCKLSLRGEERLVIVLREQFDLTGTKCGCLKGECGACSVILNGRLVNSCLVLAARCDGAKIITIEGLASNGVLDPVQKAFLKHGAFQCGFCTPGMILAVKALLMGNPNPTSDEIRDGISGNLCRCTGYLPIIEAVRDLVGGGAYE